MYKFVEMTRNKCQWLQSVLFYVSLTYSIFRSNTAAWNWGNE